MNTLIMLTAATLINTGRVIKMTQTTMKMVKGIGVAAVVAAAIGTAAGIAGSCMTPSCKRTMKCRARKAADKIGDFMDNMSGMLG